MFDARSGSCPVRDDGIFCASIRANAVDRVAAWTGADGRQAASASLLKFEISPAARGAMLAAA
jgi:hypothetical protein